VALKSAYRSTISQSTHPQKVLFASDFVDLILGRKKGNMGIWRYGSDAIHTRADGANLWGQLVDKATSYYVSRQGDSSIIENLDVLADYVGNNLKYVVEFGPGKVRGAKLLLLKRFVQHGTYMPVDVSEKFLREAYELEEKRIVACVQPIIADFEQDKILLPTDGKKAFLFFGSTIGNVIGDEKTDPKQHMQAILSKFKDRMAKGDVLIVGYDSCQDSKTILDCYNDPYSVEFMISPLYRALYELEPRGGFDPDSFTPEFVWHADVGQCAHTVVSNKSQTFSIHDQICSVRQGQRLILSSSYKFSDADMMRYFSEAGFGHLEITGRGNNPMKLIMATKI
jgi:uncharacterized SAM-dependent methyltransferase